MALFLVMVLLVSSQVVLNNLATEGRRRREVEMIWRGKQYERAIRLYFRKTGHYPQSVDDLQKGLPGLHFLRPAAYKDPMNKSDGSWRLIWVNASGQIIGSVRYASLQQMALLDLSGGKTAASAQTNATSGSDQNSVSDAGNQQPVDQQSSSGSGQGSLGTGGQPSNSLLGQTSQSGNTSPVTNSGMGGSSLGLGTSLSSGPSPLSNAPQLQPTGPVDGPVLGAFITGVAGGNHYDSPSVKVYKGGKTYQQWEFIWNPLEEQARALQNGLGSQGQQTGSPGLPIANPSGGGTGTAPTPPVNPPSGAGPGSQPPQPPDQPLIQ